MTQRLGVGIIGLGSIGRTHARALATFPDEVELVGAVRTSREALDELGLTGARVFSSAEELIADPAVDVVVIASPSEQHADQTVAAIRAGKAAVVEKPIALTFEEVERIEDALRENPVFVSVIAQRRFERQHLELRDLLRSGALGRIVLAETFVHWHRDDAYYASAPWRALAPGGGSLMNQALHSVDLLDWLVGPFGSVTGYTATLNHDMAAEDSAVVALRLADGGLGVIASTTAIKHGEPAELAIRTTEGTVTLSGADIVRWDFDGVPQPETAPAAASGANDPSAIGIAGHVAQWADILGALREGREPLIPARDGLRTARIIASIYRSAETGEHVSVKDA